MSFVKLSEKVTEILTTYNNNNRKKGATKHTYKRRRKREKSKIASWSVLFQNNNRDEEGDFLPLPFHDLYFLGPLVGEKSSAVLAMCLSSRWVFLSQCGKKIFLPFRFYVKSIRL